MNFNNFTIKSQEAVQQAVNVTQARGQQAIEPVHLLAGVLKVGENVTNFIFQKLGMNAQQIALVIDKQIDSLPKVSGGEPYLSRESNEILQRAVQYSKEMGDEFVSLEAIILALLNVKSTVATILKDAGMTDKELRSAIAELRKGEKSNFTIQRRHLPVIGKVRYQSERSSPAAANWIPSSAVTKRYGVSCRF